MKRYMAKVLVVEDDAKLNRAVSSYLRDQGYQVVSCTNADDGLEQLSNQIIDLIISDIMMPGIDGFEFADSVRRINETIPILFMTALDDLSSKRKGFRLGIDDYMVKPIEFDELLMRVEALLRRAHIANEKKIIVDNLILDADEMTVYLDEEEIPFTVREFHVLYKLLSYPKKNLYTSSADG